MSCCQSCESSSTQSSTAKAFTVIIRTGFCARTRRYLNNKIKISAVLDHQLKPSCNKAISSNCSNNARGTKTGFSIKSVPVNNGANELALDLQLSRSQG